MWAKWWDLKAVGEGGMSRRLTNVGYSFAVVFTNFIWSFEYYPGHNMDNVAILTETVWGENSM